MQLQHHLAGVSDQIAAAAALGDERAKEVAAALATASTSAVRLALLAAATELAGEITAALLDYPGSPAVTVRLDGDEIGVDVRPTSPAREEPEAARRDDGEPSARISLRLSETLKAEIDAAAEREGISVNTWLVRAAGSALHPNPFPAFTTVFGQSFGGRGKREGSHITGWING